MHHDWTHEIRREFTGGEARFELPARPLGWGKLMGVVMIGFGLLFVWWPARGLFETVERMEGTSQQTFELVALAMQAFFVVAGCLPLGFGLLILFGRCRVEWKDGHLRSVEMLGPFRWTRRLPRKSVRKLEVGTATSETNGGPPREIRRFSALTAEFEDGTKKLVVLGYPKDWLLPLAEELKTFVGGSAFSAAAVVEVVEKPLAEDLSAEDVPEQPVESRVQVEEPGAGVRLVVPPAGIWRGSRELLIFALFWCGFMAVFTGVSVFAGGKSEGGVPFAFWIFIPVFWLIGLGLLAGAINMGRRTATLEAGGGRLRVDTRGLFGSKQMEWARGELIAIRADESGMKVNDRPVVELQIHPRTGNKVGLLAGRQDAELRWIATRLRRALEVPARVVVG